MFTWLPNLARTTFPVCKSVVDYVAAAILFALLAPLMLFLAGLIKLTSPGPAFYHQIRVGQHGRLFRMIKLRSMCEDAECDSGPVWARATDPRITPLGRFLRRTHLDELPQLVNVLRGEMSLIGPRPERPAFVEHLSQRYPRYRERLAIKPGITGLAQVVRPYDTSTDSVGAKLACDLLYIRRMCWFLDFSILLRTIGRLSGRGAH